MIGSSLVASRKRERADRETEEDKGRKKHSYVHLSLSGKPKHCYQILIRMNYLHVKEI